MRQRARSRANDGEGHCWGGLSGSDEAKKRKGGKRKATMSDADRGLRVQANAASDANKSASQLGMAGSGTCKLRQGCQGCSTRNDTINVIMAVPARGNAQLPYRLAAASVGWQMRV